MGAVLPKRIYRFGLFAADAESGKLLREGARVKLQDQPFRLLCLLLERPGEVVSREELRQALWPADTYVEFDGSLNAALKRLRYALADSADNPIFIETLPKRGYRFLAPVTVKESPPTISPPPETLAGIAIAKSEESEDQAAIPKDVGRPGNWQRTLIATAVILILALLVVASYHRLTTGREGARNVASQPQAITPRRSVAVLGFTNASGRGQDAWLSTALSEMLSTELAAGKDLRIVSSEDVARMKHELPWKDAGSLAGDTAARISKDLNSDFLVLGSYAVLGESWKSKLRLDVRLQEAKTGDILVEFSQAGGEDELFELAARSGALLRQQLGASPISPAGYEPVSAFLPSNPAALRLYSEGLGKLRSFDVAAARVLLAKSVSLEPSYPLGHAALADCWSTLGYEEMAKVEARKAFDLSASLPQAERLFIEARYREMSKDWDRAIELYRQLHSTFPDEAEYGLRLADVLTESGKGKEGLATVKQLQELPQPVNGDPRITLAAAKAYIWLGQDTEALLAARDAAANAQARGMKLAQADALYREGSALLDLGQLDKSIAAGAEAQQIYQTTGDLFGVAKALSIIGSAQFTQGNYEAATSTFSRAVEINRRIGNNFGLATDLDYLGSIYGSRGNLTNAKKVFQNALEIRLATGNKGLAASSLYELGWISQEQGDLATALKLGDQALRMYANVSDAVGQASSLQLMADTLIALGELARAKDSASEALKRAQQVGDKRLIAVAMASLGVALEEEGDLEGAQKQFADALSLSQEIGSKTYVALISMNSASAAEEQGHYSEAETSLGQARSEFQKEGYLSYQVQACALLTRALMAQGKFVEAENELSSGRTLTRRVQEIEPQIDLDIAAAELKIATGEYEQARRALLRALAKSRLYGYGRYELRARLAWGQMEAKEHPSAARAYLADLQKDANAKNFRLIARKATVLLDSLPARLNESPKSHSPA